MSILELVCSSDEFWVRFEPLWRQETLAASPTGKRHRRRAGERHPSEIMTILVLFHSSHYRTFKAYYTESVQAHLRAEFPRLVSSSRLVELIPRMLVPLRASLHPQMGAGAGLSFVDSTRWPCAAMHASCSTASSRSMPSRSMPPVAKARWGGSTASNGIW